MAKEAWLQRVKHKDGTQAWWIRDIRDGRQVVVNGGTTKREAELRLEQYKIRRTLEKEGYDDQYAAAVADELWGTKR
jgi:hypothetical protein